MKGIPLIFLALLLLVLACSPPIVNEEKIKTDTIQPQNELAVLDTANLIAINRYDTTSSYPFSEASSIELFSYPDRMSWDTLTQKHGTYFNVNILSNGKMDVDPNQIRERIVLSQDQKHKLFNLLFNIQCKWEGGSACFEPRHALVFYNKDQQAFAFIEICLKCAAVRTSDKVNFGGLCYPKIIELSKLFESFGIKYGLYKE